VNFNAQKNGQEGDATTGLANSRSEPISLSTLDRDCFIIPIKNLDRFLPAGVPVKFYSMTMTFDYSFTTPIKLIEF
jgi:hypothetical protein